MSNAQRPSLPTVPVAAQAAAPVQTQAAATGPDMQELLRRMAALEAENAQLKSTKTKSGGGRVTVKSSCLIGDTKDGNPGKGTIGVYGAARRPIGNCYANQWAKVFANGASMASYIQENLARLGFQSEEDRQVTAAFFKAAAPHLQAIAEIPLVFNKD